jgi:hypothetical protein
MEALCDMKTVEIQNPSYGQENRHVNFQSFIKLIVLAYRHFVCACAKSFDLRRSTAEVRLPHPAVSSCFRCKQKTWRLSRRNEFPCYFSSFYLSIMFI